MSDIIKILVQEAPAIIKIVNANVPSKIKIISENVVERVTQGDIVFGETPAGTINGSNATFTTAFDFVPGKVAVYVNGLLQKLITHYNTTGTKTIIFNDSPLPGDLIEVDYVKQ